MSDSLNEQIAKEMIRERLHRHGAATTSRHTRTARALRSLADRIDRRT